ncbi:hypothetical protein M3J09_006595 [Ascochyta lentis]
MFLRRKGTGTVASYILHKPTAPHLTDILRSTHDRNVFEPNIASWRGDNSTIRHQSHESLTESV